MFKSTTLFQMWYNTTCILARISNISCNLPIFNTDNELANHIYKNYFDITKECFINKTSELDYCKIYLVGSNGKYKFKNENGSILGDFRINKFSNYKVRKFNTEIICNLNKDGNGLLCADVLTPKINIYSIDSNHNIIKFVNNLKGMAIRSEKNDDQLVFFAEKIIHDRTQCQIISQTDSWVEFQYFAPKLEFNSDKFFSILKDFIIAKASNIEIMLTEYDQNFYHLYPKMWYKIKLCESKALIITNDGYMEFHKLRKYNHIIKIRIHNIEGSFNFQQNSLTNNNSNILFKNIPLQFHGFVDINEKLIQNPKFEMVENHYSFNETLLDGNMYVYAEDAQFDMFAHSIDKCDFDIKQVEGYEKPKPDAKDTSTDANRATSHTIVKTD